MKTYIFRKTVERDSFKLDVSKINSFISEMFCLYSKSEQQDEKISSMLEQYLHGGTVMVPLNWVLSSPPPFNSIEELKEACSQLTEENASCTNFYDNRFEQILYSMFPLDYSFKFHYDKLLADKDGKLYLCLEADDGEDMISDSAHAWVDGTIDTNGILLLKPYNQPKHEDKKAYIQARRKGRIFELLQRIARHNTKLNDTSFDTGLDYDSYMECQQQFEDDVREVWKYYTQARYYKPKNKCTLSDGATEINLNIQTVQGDMIMHDKNVGTQIGVVKSGGIGVKQVGQAPQIIGDIVKPKTVN